MIIINTIEPGHTMNEGDNEEQEKAGAKRMENPTVISPPLVYLSTSYRVAFGIAKSKLPFLTTIYYARQ